MRRTNGTSDEEPVTSVTRPEDLGWDDSLYDDAPASGGGGSADGPGGDEPAAGETTGDTGPSASAGGTADTGAKRGRRAVKAEKKAAKQAAKAEKRAARTGRSPVAGEQPAGERPGPPDGEAEPDPVGGRPAVSAIAQRSAASATARPAADGGGGDSADSPAGAAPSEPGDGKPKRRRWVRVATAIGACCAVLIAGAGIAGYFYIEHLNSNLTKADLHLGDNKLDKPPPNADGQTPLNILLIGSDARDSDENLDLGGARHTADGPPIADVQMLLHVAADRSNMTVISIPRDTRVSIPKCTDSETGETYEAVASDTINHSLQRGGPGCTVATWEELTGIPIDHFMMLDFAGVVSMADAVGGVPVCVTDNVYDRRSGLELEAGESVVKGEQALQWLRTRHGFEDGSDVGRTKAQHMYLSAMVRELQAGTKLTEPAQLNSLANAATNALTVDNGLGSVNRLYSLGEDLRDVPTERINMITMPWVPDPQNPGAHIVPQPGAAAELFSLVREDIALDEDPLEPEELEEIEENDRTDRDSGDGDEADEATGPAPQDPTAIPLAVRNGTGTVSLAPVTGRAGDIANQLYAQGFVQAWTDERPSSQAETTLLHPETEQARANAELVAESLNLPQRAIRPSSQTDGLMLIIGADWREGVTYPAPPEENEQSGAPAAPDVPEERLDAEAALSGDDESACMTVNPAYTW